MKVNWSAAKPICSEIADLARGDVTCWIEDGSGVVVVGTPDQANEPARSAIDLGGEEVGTACAVGPENKRWAQFLATAIGRELAHKATVGNMANATARLWKHTNALMRMAAISHISHEPARIVNNVLGTLHRATRLLPGLGLIRLPGQETYTVFKEDGVDTVEPMVLAPLYGVTDEVRLVAKDDSIEGLMKACAEVVGTETPVAMARLATDHEQFGFLLAPVENSEEITSEDLKMLAAAAQVISVAIENGCTLIKEREATRLHVENELLSAQTRDMEEMVHVVAHDLRSPMTALYGFLHVSLDELKDLRKRLVEEGFAAIGPYADSVADPLRDGIRSVEKLNRMVQRLLEFSRSARAAYAFEKVDLGKLVSGVIRSLGYQLNKSEIAVEVGQLPSVTGDRVQLEAVFGNLIDNAIKYMGRGSERAIKVGCDDAAEPVYFVQDTGIGMSSDEVPKAFLPFQRFHSDAAPGDGIGLPHVRKIIERHGGRIWCESTKGSGTTFYFTLGSALPEGRLAETSEIQSRRVSQQPPRA